MVADKQLNANTNWAGKRILCLVAVVVLVAGCGDSLGNKVRKAVEAIDLMSLGEEGVFSPSEVSASRILDGANPQEVAQGLAVIFEKSQDPATRAKAVTLTRFCLEAKDADTANGHETAMGIALGAIDDDSPSVVYCAVRVLRGVSGGTEEAKQRLLKKAQTTDDIKLLTYIYSTLFEWGEQEALLSQLSQPRPPAGSGSDVARWRSRMQSVLNVVADTRRQWHARASLVDGLLSLMKADGELIAGAAPAMLALNARDAIPGMKALLASTQRTEDRVYLAATIVALEPGLTEVREQLSPILTRIATEGSAGSGGLSVVVHINSYLALCAIVSKDEGLMREAWNSYKSLPIKERAELMRCTLLNLAGQERLFLALLGDIPDAGMKEMCAANPPLAKGLKFLADGIAPSGDGDAVHAELRERIARILQPTKLETQN